MKLIKNSVIKDIEERLVADYISAGWKKYKEEAKEIKKEEIKKEKK